MADSSALKEFMEYWNDRVRFGHSSSLSRMEIIAIEIFHNWLLSEYKLDKKIVTITDEQLATASADVQKLIADEFEPREDGQ